jgi:hypothetical protein
LLPSYADEFQIQAEHNGSHGMAGLMPRGGAEFLVIGLGGKVHSAFKDVAAPPKRFVVISTHAASGSLYIGPDLPGTADLGSERRLAR